MTGSLFARELSFQEHIDLYVNIVPFRSIYRYTLALLRHTMNIWTPIINLFGNIFVFIPLGIFIPILFQRTRRFIKMVFISVGSILVVELIQFFTYTGTFDIDDIILNTLGVTMGYICWKIFSKNRELD
jgi:glycopeptide antibiotics resistance protein